MTELLINPNDFVSLELAVDFKNTSTRTEISNRKDISVAEIGDAQIVFQLPASSCNLHHNVMFDIFKVEKQKQELLFRATAKIISADKMEDDTLRVTAKLIQYDDQSWQKFLGLYSQRQEEINQFLETIRG